MGNLLRDMNYSLKANSKTRESSRHIDRDAQFRYINGQAVDFLTRALRTIVQLIAATTTKAGLKVRAELDEKKYPKGVKVSDAELAALNLTRHDFHGDCYA